MELTQGGRVTLRLSSGAGDAVEYEGTLETAPKQWPVRIRVTTLDGVVTVTPAGAAPPAWLVDLARTTLRTAWRASKTGTAWPRRVSRWRDAGEPEDG